MRKLIIWVCLFIACSAIQAKAYTIDDNYFGGTPTHSWSNRDVIGDYKYYDIAGMNVATAGSTMTVDIITSFVAQTSSHTIWGEQTKIGDLFLGTGGWKPYGSPNYAGDNYLTSNTKWDYVLVLTPHVPTQDGDPVLTGTASLYSTNNGSFIKSNIGTLDENHWVYREGQYVQFNPVVNAVPLYLGTWTINPNYTTINGDTYGDLKVTFDYLTINAQSSDWAFHWGMTCGNDVIEGQTRVPEPTGLLLFGSGLIGLAGLRRKLKR